MDSLKQRVSKTQRSWNNVNSVDLMIIELCKIEGEDNIYYYIYTRPILHNIQRNGYAYRQQGFTESHTI